MRRKGNELTKTEKTILADIIDTDFYDVTKYNKLTEEDTRRGDLSLLMYNADPKEARKHLRNKKSIKSKSKRKIKKKNCGCLK